jgi:hypothetical protein
MISQQKLQIPQSTPSHPEIAGNIQNCKDFFAHREDQSRKPRGQEKTEGGVQPKRRTSDIQKGVRNGMFLYAVMSCTCQDYRKLKLTVSGENHKASSDNLLSLHSAKKWCQEFF